MNTPIFDFLSKYSKSEVSKLHMPGHKGIDILGVEKYDLTEIKGADDLYDAQSIILESENNATYLFDTLHTYYSTNGSTQCLKAMVYIAYICKTNNSNIIISTRNSHKSFINVCAFLDLDVEWLYPENYDNICSCQITAEDLEDKINLMNIKPFAVFITSPDYLGNIQNVQELSIVCKRYNIPLLVDNAHGAYLKFLNKSIHPIDLGADMCCDSAHKTLSVITGGAYLHISKNSNKEYIEYARKALSIFGSSSPSYIVLASLDLCNRYLSKNYKEKLNNTIREVENIKIRLKHKGIIFNKTEPLKLVLNTYKIGYNGNELSDYLRKNKIECEFADVENVVMMYTEKNTIEDFYKIEKALKELQIKKEIKNSKEIKINKNKRKISIREASLSKRENIDIEKSENRICVSADLLCPPAIPLIVSGEIIDKNTIKLLRHYKIKRIDVVK